MPLITLGLFLAPVKEKKSVLPPQQTGFPLSLSLSWALRAFDKKIYPNSRVLHALLLSLHPINSVFSFKLSFTPVASDGADNSAL